MQEKRVKRSEPKFAEVETSQTLEPEREEEKDSSSDKLSNVQL